MLFEWDEEKEQINIAKHGIDFAVASLVFGDPFRLEKYDDIHSTSSEDRYITIGAIGNLVAVVMVAYATREETIRIISARMAANAERGEYYLWLQKK